MKILLHYGCLPVPTPRVVTDPGCLVVVVVCVCVRERDGNLFS